MGWDGEGGQLTDYHLLENREPGRTGAAPAAARVRLPPAARMRPPGRTEEDPRVPTLAVAGALDGHGRPELVARLNECRDVLLPAELVEVHREEPAGLVGEQRVDSDDATAGEMPADHLVGHGKVGWLRVGGSLEP